MRSSEWRWRITCRYRSRNQNGNFRKFNMADGRHFENSFISISQSRIIRFRSNLVSRCKFPFREWIFDQKSKFFKFKMADGRHIENQFFAISRRHIGWSTRNSERVEESLADIGHMTKREFFENSRWRTGAILKIALSAYLSRELSFLNQIWYTDANFHSEDGILTKKIEIFQIQDGWRRLYWQSLFGIISAPYWPINAKFGMEMKNHIQI